MADDLDAQDGERLEGKRDRLARLLSVLRVLHAHGESGVTPREVARRTGMSPRTVYRDLNALQNEMHVPLWSEDGLWGVQPGAFLPAMRLTLQEAMAVFLAARLMTRYTDRFDDPNLPGEMVTTVSLKAVSCGTELQVVQEGIPEQIPVEMCYLGWQESLEQLARLVDPEIPDA